MKIIQIRTYAYAQTRIHACAENSAQSVYILMYACMRVKTNTLTCRYSLTESNLAYRTGNRLCLTRVISVG